MTEPSQEAGGSRMKKRPTAEEITISIQPTAEEKRKLLEVVNSMKDRLPAIPELGARAAPEIHAHFSLKARPKKRGTTRTP